jgi:hypothetical protein
MFLHELTPQETTAFLSLAQQLISVDGKIQGQEQEMLARFAREMEIPAEVREQISTTEAAVGFQSKRSRNIALLELIGLAYADEAFVLGEAQFINQLVEAFGADREHITAMDAWIREVIGLTRKAMDTLLTA